MNSGPSNSQDKSPVQVDDEVNFSKDFVYVKGADATVRFKDGKILKFNKSAIVANSKSKIMYEVFFGDLRDQDGITDIPDCNYESFKLFFDCIMGYEKYTYDNAFTIFPIAWKYQIQHIIENCIKIFKQEYKDSSKYSLKLMDLLNMAAFLGCDSLTKQSLCDLFRTCDFYELFDKYYNELNADAMRAVLCKKHEMIDSFDSQILENLMAWANCYVENNPDCFETAGALQKFCASEIGKNFFTSQQILHHLENSSNLRHGKSEWKKVEKHGTITEEIAVSEYLLEDLYDLDCAVAVKIERNKIIPFQQHSSDQMNVICTVNFVGVDNQGFQFAENLTELDFYGCDSDPDPDEIHMPEEFYHIKTKDLKLKPTKCYRRTFSLKLRWTFLKSCRVLLTNRLDDEFNDCEEMYFAKNVSVNTFNLR